MIQEENDKLMNQCPIQIIDIDTQKGGLNNTRWIALAKDIDYESKRYFNICPYHPKTNQYHTKLDKLFFWRLFNGISSSKFAPWDIIRNPTFEEIREISDAAKILNIKINLKTNECFGDFHELW